MEQSDAALRGQDDIFELDDADALKGKRSGAGYDDSSDEEGDSAEEEEDGEVLDLEEERERKVAGLEDELDGLYDAYQEHLKERDAKYRVKEARKNSKAREEWRGIGKGDDSDSGDAEEGGYERVQRAKARIGENDSDSGDQSSDEEDVAVSSRMTGKKRRRTDGPAEGLSKNKKARTLMEPEGPKTTAPLTRSAQLWFDQDIFAGADEDVEDDDEDEEEDEVDEDEEMSEESGGDAEEEVSFEDNLSSMLPNAIHHRLDGVMMTSRLYHKIKTMMWRCGTSTARTRTKSSRRKFKVSLCHLI